MTILIKHKHDPIEPRLNGDRSTQTTDHKLNRLKKVLRKHKDGVTGYMILTPIFIYFLIFSIFPVLFVIYLSFTEWNGIGGSPQWSGIRNYINFFTTSDYVATLVRAGIYGFTILFLSVIVGFLIALLLNQKVIGSGLIRTIWYLPVLVSFAVVAQMVNTVLDPVNGIVKQMMIGLGIEPIIFQESALWMSFWIITISVWKGIGGTVIIYLAGLQSVDTTLYEAAHVDGANGRQVLWYVTIPSLRPITMFVLITGIIGSFQIFEPIQLISKGGPFGQTNIILYRIYQDAFQSFNIGMASASSVIVLIATLILSIWQYRNSSN